MGTFENIFSKLALKDCFKMMRKYILLLAILCLFLSVHCENKKVPCKDIRHESTCKRWNERTDYCSTDEYVQKNCRKTCGLCDTELCKDISSESLCGVWKYLKKCTDEYIVGQCQKTCGLCDTGSAPQNADFNYSRELCKDISPEPLCGIWEHQGHCVEI